MRLELDRLVKITDGLLELLHRQVDTSAVQVTVRVMRPDLKDVIEVPERLVELTQFKINLPAFLIAARKVRIPLDHLEIIRQSGLVFFLPTIGVATLEISINQVRANLDRPAEVLDGPVMLVELGAVNFAPTRESFGKVRLKRDGFVEVSDR